MMGKIAESAAPTYAIPTWVDGNNLYFELRGVNGPSVISFPRTSFGFQKALAILFGLHETEGHGEVYSRPQLASSIPDKNGITDRQRQDARDLLKRLKII